MKNENNFFSPKRFTLLLKKNILSNISTISIAYAAITGLFIFIMFWVSFGFYQNGNVPSDSSQSGYIIFFLITLFLYGLFWASRSFTSMYRKNSNHDWLMTPVSPIERIFENYLITTIFQIFVAIIATFVAWGILSAITSIAFGFVWELFIPEYVKIAGKLLPIYISVVPIFLMCSSIFKRVPFFQFFLWTFIITTAWGAIAALLGWILFGTTQFEGNVTMYEAEGWLVFFKWLYRIGFYFLLPAFCLIVSYFKLKEVESQDGI